MLQKQHRLHARTRLVNPNTYHAGIMIITYAPNNISTSRFGFIVSKRVDNRSTVRNRLKRVVRSCVEARKDAFPKGYDMLFILKRNEERREKLCDAIQAVIQSMSK